MSYSHIFIQPRYPFKPVTHVVETTVGGSHLVPLRPTCRHNFFNHFKPHITSSLPHTPASTSHILLTSHIPETPTTALPSSLSTTTLLSLLSADYLTPDVLPLSSQHIKPKKPHAGCQNSQNSLHPHVATADSLFAWDTPHAVRHQQRLLASLHPHLVNSAMMAIHGAYAPNTKTTYAASTLHFTQFCDRWGITEEVQMPASYPLLCAFIGEYKGRQAGNTICSWLSGIRAWHVVNHAPWFGNDEWVQLALMSANEEGTKHQHPLCAPVSIKHLLALRHALNIYTPFHAVVWALALCTFFSC